MIKRLSPRVSRWLVMLVLSFSGGVIFMLPFLQEVYYIPLADAMNLTHTQVGSLMSAFGVSSMICYFPGGWLADRVSARKLTTVALLSTGIAGLYFSTFPSYEISLAIHAFWGVSINLLFWGAMIRATRNWAPAEEQGRAFGYLETGRGLGEVLSSAALLAVFAMLGSGRFALSVVVAAFSGLLLVLGVLAWLAIDRNDANADLGETEFYFNMGDITTVLKLPATWMIGLIILTGYSAYWGTFRFTSYASDVFMLSVTVGAAISIGKMWLKPLAAFVAGFVADRFGIAKVVAVLFFLLLLTFSGFAVLPGAVELIPVMLFGIALTSVIVFAMRGIYFALLEEGGIPVAMTGTAAGVISIIGYTPDIFMPLLGGALIDRFPDGEGYRYFFLATAAICALGLVTSILLYRKTVRH